MERLLIAIFFATTLALLLYPQTIERIAYSTPEITEEPIGIAHAAEEPNTVTVWVTAYSSTPEETDDTPFITALGTEVRDGIVATNIFPFGTKLHIPKLFGDKLFVVEDRMHYRKQNFVDIWMPTKEEAQEFGIHRTEIVILEHPHEVALVE